MRKLVAATSFAALVFGAGAAAAEPVSGTSGPYAVVMESDPTLPDHTIYRPADLKAVKGAVPFIAWGNGGCANVGNAFKTFLSEVASRGYVITAPGPIDPNWGGFARPQGGARPGQSKPGQMLAALAWAEGEAKRSGSVYRGKLDVSKVAVAGQSCGGLEAIAAGGDPRVDTVMVLNSWIIRGGIPNPDGTTRAPSGYLPAGEADLPKLHTPVVYLIGGEKDQAWRGAEGDFAALTKVPVFNANMDVGHGGTWREPRGGAMGEAAIAWLDWKLKGDAKAGEAFTGQDCGLCKDARWTVKTKNFN